RSPPYCVRTVDDCRAWSESAIELFRFFGSRRKLPAGGVSFISIQPRWIARPTGETMTRFLIALFLAASAMSQTAQVTPLLSRDVTGITGKEGTMLTVEIPPGGSSAEHRHNAHVFVYVLEGSVVMQVKGGKETTLIPGQTFYESPDDVHTVSRNA